MDPDAPVIAVLDDEMEMRKALRRLLSCHGFRVEEHESGEGFLATLGAHSLVCLLLDLHMEGINGFDVLEALRTRRTSTPVIVITAHDEPDTEAQVRALGAVAYLKKPVDRDILLAAIKAASATKTEPASADHPDVPMGKALGIEAPTKQGELVPGRREESGASVDEETDS